VSRSGADHTARFSGIAAAVAGLLAPQLILDGEVCVFDDQLVSQFHLLGWGGTAEATIQTPPVYMVFDCLHERGRDLRPLPREAALGSSWSYRISNQPALRDVGHLDIDHRASPQMLSGWRAHVSAARGAAVAEVVRRRTDQLIRSVLSVALNAACDGMVSTVRD
jgi:hypothetical protein